MTKFNWGCWYDYIKQQPLDWLLYAIGLEVDILVDGASTMPRKYRAGYLESVRHAVYHLEAEIARRDAVT